MTDLRHATHADVPAIRDLVRRAYTPYVAVIGRAPGPMGDDYQMRVELGQALVAEIDGRIAALLVLVEEPDALLLDNVAVSPDAQGRGLGRRLMDEAERIAIASGRERIRLYTNAAMVENVAIYRRLGYVETHRARQDGLDRVFMEKRL